MSELLTALAVVFLAELGDKTQLVALGFGARQRLAPVLAGIALAYVAAGLVSVVVGGVLGAALPTRAIGLVGGVVFLVFAIWTVRGDDAETPPPDVSDGSDGRGDVAAPAHHVGELRVVGSVAGAMFVAELGDKTMIATATLAARDDPVLVWVGATIGIFLAGALGVLVGRFMGARLPERATRLGAAAVFAVFGVILIVTA